MGCRLPALLLTLLQLLLAPKPSVHATLVGSRKAATAAGEVGALLQPSSAVSRLCDFSSPGKAWAGQRCQGNGSLSFLALRHSTVSKYARNQKAAVGQRAGLLDFVMRRRGEGLSLNSSAAAFSAPDHMQNGAGGKIRKVESFGLKEGELEGEGREAALLHQRQQLAELLNPATDERENASSDMTDEEFEEEVQISVSASPQAVVTALSKWKKQNPSSPLKPQLHRKWMEVFGRNVLRHLQLHAEQNTSRKNILNRALRILLGGSPLSSHSPTEVPEEAPSELDPAYGQLALLPEAFRDLSAKIREQEEEKLTPWAFLKREASGQQRLEYVSSHMPKNPFRQSVVTQLIRVFLIFEEKVWFKSEAFPPFAFCWLLRQTSLIDCPFRRRWNRRPIHVLADTSLSEEFLPQRWRPWGACMFGPLDGSLRVEIGKQHFS
ncbi:hypothetical protein Esti_006843 [Eimeria stiedai]